VSPIEYACGKRSLRAYIAVCPQIHCNPSSYNLLDVNCKTFNKKYNLVTEIQNFKKLNLKRQFPTCERSLLTETVEYRARKTLQFLSRNMPDFISPLTCPSNFPDLNHVDYEDWGVLQRHLYCTKISNVDHLKQRLVKEWRLFSQDVTDRAVRQWRDFRQRAGHSKCKL